MLILPLLTDASHPVTNAINAFRRRFILHTRRLQHIRPLAARPSMTMLKMLPEVIRAEELLRVVALAELVDRSEMLRSSTQISRIGKLLAAVAADVEETGFRRRSVEGGFDACQSVA